MAIQTDLHDAARNQIWMESGQTALDRWPGCRRSVSLDPAVEAHRPRLRLFPAAAQLIATGWRRIVRLAKR